MPKFLLAILLVSTAAIAENKHQLSNDRFAVQIGDIQPILWKDFEAIQKNVYTCLDDKKLDTPLCKKVQERMEYALYDSLSQALVLNKLAKSGDPKFCETYGQQLILDHKFGQAASYALLIIDDRLKYGSSLYGSELPNIYVGKFIHDALLESEPCKP